MSTKARKGASQVNRVSFLRDNATHQVATGPDKRLLSSAPLSSAVTPVRPIQCSLDVLQYQKYRTEYLDTEC